MKLYLLEEQFRIRDVNPQEVYQVFHDSYQKSTGTSWPYEKFLNRASNWVFYGDSYGYVAVRPQRSGMVKIVGVAGKLPSILNGFNELMSENHPTWGVASEDIVNMAVRKGMIAPHKILGGPTVLKMLFKAIPSNVFGSVPVEVGKDGSINIDYDDVGNTKKFFFANKEYYKHLVTNPMIKNKFGEAGSMVNRFIGMVLKYDN